MQTSMRRRHRERVVRRGIGLVIESEPSSHQLSNHPPSPVHSHPSILMPPTFDFRIIGDFYATEAGRSHFANQLTSIRYCVQETW